MFTVLRPVVRKGDFGPPRDTVLYRFLPARFPGHPYKDNVTCASLTASVKFSSTRVQFDRGELIQYFNSKSIFQAALFDWFIRRLVPFQRKMPTDSPIRRGLPRFAPIFDLLGGDLSIICPGGVIPVSKPQGAKNT